MYSMWQKVATRYTSLCKIAALYKITGKELGLHTSDLSCPDHRNCVKKFVIVNKKVVLVNNYELLINYDVIASALL